MTNTKSFAVRLVGEKYVVEILAAHSRVRALEMAPRAREPFLNSGRWLLLVFPVWSAPDQLQVRLLIELADAAPPELQFGVRPFHDHKEIEPWLGAVPATVTRTPIWLLLDDGSLHLIKAPRASAILCRRTLHDQMMRTPILGLVLACLSCTKVSASLGLPSEPGPAPTPGPAASARHHAPVEVEAVPDLRDQLRAIDASNIFAGEVELQVPHNLVGLHPFGSTDVIFEFEQSQGKVARQRKLPGAWEGKLVRWVRRDPSAVDPTPLQTALAHHPSWSLAPPGCDDARDQCYVREASIRWLEHDSESARGRAQGLIEVGGSADEAGPARYMLVTTIVRDWYGYALIYELHADQWLANEELLRASAQSFTIK